MMGMADTDEKAGRSAERLYGEVLECATNSILRAASFEAPYPHIHFRDFFPGEFYRLLLERFPSVDRFMGLNGGGTRRQFNLYDDRADPGSEEGRAAWSIVARVLSSPEIQSALRARLEAGFRIRAKRSREGWPIPMFPRPVLYTDLDGYAIKPHPDTRRKVLTMQIYLPADDTQRDLGTAIYKISPMGVFAWKSYGLVKEKTCAVPSQYRLRVRRHSPGLLAVQGELARTRGDIRSCRQAAPVDPQHLLPRAC